MRETSRWALACLLLWIAPAVGAQSGGGDGGDPTEVELRALFEQFADSALRGDAAGVDEATCLGDMVYSELAREQALGRIPDARDPALLEQRKRATRAAAFAFVERLFEAGRQIELMDVSRVELFSGDGTTLEKLRGELEELEITGAGVLGVKMLASPRTVDVDVCRVGERWCLNPLSMQ